MGLEVCGGASIQVGAGSVSSSVNSTTPPLTAASPALRARAGPPPSRRTICARSIPAIESGPSGGVLPSSTTTSSHGRAVSWAASAAIVRRSDAWRSRVGITTLTAGVAPPPTVSVVVPTRDRHASLRRTVAALAAQETARPWELIVVDDGSTPPVGPELLAGVPGARVLRREGNGPARARNAGLAEARGAIVLFTDDDTEPDPTWIEAAAAHLDAHPGDLGVEGAVRTPAFDPLYALSLENDAPGAYWTCNIGFRRAVLLDIEGFSEDYPFPHCEDLDLAYKVLRRGPIGFAPAMAIVHHPRAMTARQWIRRGRMARSEMLLFARFRERFGRARRLPQRLFPLVATAGVWGVLLREGRRGPLRRAVRAAAIGVGYTATVAWVALRPGRSS